MKLSVAMCTYNGAKYIRQQLDSMLDQTLPLDEIVICDDGSTDDTHRIIREYQERYPGVIQLHINEHNLGVCANFDKALHLCTSDIIFLADQDDIWYKDKTKIICRYFEKHKNKSVVFTNADLIDNDNQKYEQWPRTLFESFGFNTVAKVFFTMGYEPHLIFKHFRTTGATMALRSSFLDKVRIDPTADLVNLHPLHDALIGLSATVNHSLGYISDKLMAYRCHPEQQTGANFKYRITNNVITPYYYDGLYIIDNPYIDDAVRETYRFIISRQKDKNNPRNVLKKARLYIKHYTVLSAIVFGYDLSKAVYRHLRKK